MADQKITSKTELTTLTDLDVIHVVDVSDPTDDPAGTSKQAKVSLLVTAQTDQLGGLTGDKTWDGKHIFKDTVDGLNEVADTETQFNFANFARQGLGSEPIAAVWHHYTDGKMMQLDNVGTNTILTLKNAQNIIRRPDEANTYVGTGKFLSLIKSIAGAPSTDYELLYITKDGVIGMPSTTDNFRVELNKVSDGQYAFQFMTFSGDQVALVNFNNAFKINTESASYNGFISDRGVKFYINNGTVAYQISSTLNNQYIPIDFYGANNRIRAGAQLQFYDDTLLIIGSGNDLQIKHDGTDTLFDLYNGDLVIRENTTEKIRFERSTGKINAIDCNFSGLPTYADDTAAGSGGAATGDLYQTATGEMRIKL